MSLAMGDVDRPNPNGGVDSSRAGVRNALRVASTSESFAEDMTGYDEHCRRFSLMIPCGITAMIWGAAAGVLFDEENSILGINPVNGFLTFLCIAAVGAVVHVGMRQGGS